MRNQAREEMHTAVREQLAAQGDHKAMNKYLKELRKTAYPDENGDDKAEFIAKYGGGF